MSDAARHAAYFVPEVTFGTTPPTPAFKRLRHTGLTLGVQRGSLQSEELRPDRQIQDFRLGTVAVAGDVNAELSFDSFDELLEAVLLGTWNTASVWGQSTDQISVNGPDNSFNAADNSFDPVVAGQLIQVSGFEDEANNGLFKVVSGTISKIIVQETLISESAKPIDISSIEMLRAGTERRSFSVLRHFTDIAATGEGKPYHLFNGVEFNTLALAINPTAIITATFGVMGREGIAPSNTPPTGSTFVAASTATPLDAFTGQLKEGNNVVGIVTEFSANLDNGMEARNVVGSKFSLRPSIGRSNLTGSATVFFEDAAFVSKFLNETETAFSMELPDAAGNRYIFEFPRIKFTSGQPDVAGQGSITLSMPFQGLFDNISQSNITIHRIPA